MDGHRRWTTVFYYCWIRYLLMGFLLMIFLIFNLGVHQSHAEFLYGEKIDRVKDVLFTNTVIGGREITCSERPLSSENSVFPADTWSCYNIRIDGRRLQYWHMDGLCSEDKSPSTANDYGALCMSIMGAHQVQRPLWAAMISNVSCKVSDEDRVLYVMTEEEHVWRDYQAGRGYVISLQCMADPDRKPHR